MPIQHFFIDGQYIAQASRGPYTDPSGITYHPSSLAWFCPICGEVWARACVDGAMFTTVPAVCRKHPATTAGPYDRRFPGAIWATHLGRLLKDLPEAVVRKEFLLHLDYAESNSL